MMIDYEKLKEAHALSRKLPFKIYSFDCWCCSKIESGLLYVLMFEDHEGIQHHHESENIDELILMLHDLIKTKTKYKTGQDVWFIDCTKINGPISKGKVLFSKPGETK